MHAAELKTLRESVGLSINELARMAGAQDHSVRNWESGKTGAPENVSSLLTALDRMLSISVDAALSFARDRINTDGKPTDIVLLRYKTDADLWQYQPDFEGLPVSVHTAMLKRARAALADLHVRTSIVEMDTGLYKQWLNGRADNTELRTEWAGVAGRQR